MKDKVKSKSTPPVTSEITRRSLDSIPDSNDSLDTETSEREKSLISSYWVKAYLFAQQFSPKRICALLTQKKESAAENFRILARVMKYMADQKILMVFAYISLICVAMAQTKMPQLASSMIDSVVLEKSSSSLNKQALNFLIVAIIYSVSEYFWGHLFDVLCARIKERLKHQVYSSVIQKDIGFFDKKSLNEVLYYINTQIDWVQNVCTNRFASFGRNFIQLLYSAWMLAFTSYKLTLFLFLIVPINLMLAFGYSRISEKIATKERQSFLKTNRRVSEAFQNIRIVKAYSTEDMEINQYGDLMKNDMRHSRLFSLANASHAALSGFFSNFTLLCIVFIGMSLVNSGEVTPGTLSGFLIYSISVSISFRDAGNSYARIKESIPFCREFFALLDDVPQIKYKGGKTIENFQGRIELNKVAFKYPTAPDVTILKNVTLTINPGESVAFVGMSGGGKSTIVSILLRFYDVAQGEVTFDGVNLKDLDLKWVHEKIGYVSQEPILFSGTFEENMVYGLESYTQEKIIAAIKMANADFIFDEKLFPKGLASDIGERGSRLSGGQKQRLAIARALIREPKILIFDEATSNLDTNSEFEVQKAIDNLISTSHITTVTIAHRLSTILKCKVIYVIKNGEIIEKGSHQELVAQQGAYKTLVEKQLKTLH